jgi:hypothetical protein
MGTDARTIVQPLPSFGQAISRRAPRGAAFAVGGCGCFDASGGAAGTDSPAGSVSVAGRISGCGEVAISVAAPSRSERRTAETAEAAMSATAAVASRATPGPPAASLRRGSPAAGIGGQPVAAFEAVLLARGRRRAAVGALALEGLNRAHAAPGADAPQAGQNDAEAGSARPQFPHELSASPT